MSSLTVKKEVCSVCEKTVYPTEQVKADDKLYHRGCFRCEYCQGTLKLGSFASMDGRVFCKPHFKQLFNSKGNYSEGFGKLKPQQEFEAKKRGDTDNGETTTDRAPPPDVQEITVEVTTEIIVTPVENGANNHPEDEPVSEPPTQTTNDTETTNGKAEVTSPAVTQQTTTAVNHEETTTAPPREETTATTTAPQEETTTATKSSGPATLSVPPPTHSGNASPVSDKTKRLTPTSSPKIAVTQNKCCVCGLTVYDKERVREDNAQGESFLFHKACFRCKVCNNVLKIGNFAALNSEFYCKPHFKQLFASKGNYSEGFGMLKPQHEFEARKKGDSEKTDEVATQ